MVIACYCGNKTSRNNTNEPAGLWEKHRHTVSCKHTWFGCTEKMGLWRKEQFIWMQQAPSTTSIHPPYQSETANNLSYLEKKVQIILEIIAFHLPPCLKFCQSWVGGWFLLWREPFCAIHLIGRCLQKSLDENPFLSQFCRCKGCQ